MRILVFSDIHGNLYTLEKLIEEDVFSKVDYSIFCGDIFGYYYDTNKIINYFKLINNISLILGNHDKLFLDMIDGNIEESELVRTYGKSYTISRMNIEKENIQYIRNLNHCLDINLYSKRILAMHGSIEDKLNGRIYPNSDLKIEDKYTQYDYLIFGHTHYKMIKKINNTIIINPGSLGQPRDGGYPSYIIIDTSKNKVNFYEVKYDKYKLVEDIKRYKENNRYLIDILYRGEKYE